MSSEIINDITAFWLGDSLQSFEAAFARREFWYKGGQPVDDEIRARFGDLLPRAVAGEFQDWEDTSEGAFALILLLDQFTRNLFRNTPDAYLGDARAFEVVCRAIERGTDRALHPVSRIWLYHPFHHSEVLAEQDRGLGLLEGLRETAVAEWVPHVERSIMGWTRHRNIVARFGRFPHRNEVLGRASTGEELAFLESEGESFGQGPRRVKDI